MASSGGAKKRGQEVGISQIEIMAFCHATEDCSRVEESIKNVLPHDMRKSIKMSLNVERGYYGNPITIIIAKIADRQQVNTVIKYITAVLEDLEKKILRSTFDLRYDHKTGRFIIRFSKQDALLGQLKITDSDDVIKVVLHIKNSKNRSSILKHLTDIGLLQ